MSRKPEELFTQAERPGLMESIKEAGAALRQAGGAIWDAGKPMFDHGRTEAAAALFRGDAHVMYMKGTGSEQEQGQAQGKDVEPTKQPEAQQQQDRGGMGM